MPLNAASYIPETGGRYTQSPLEFKVNEWLAHKLGIQTEADQRLQQRLEERAKSQAEQKKWETEQRQKQADEEFKYHQAGYVPLDTGTAADARPSIRQGDSSAFENATPANTITDSQGRRWSYQPSGTPASLKGALTESQALARGGEPLNAQGQVYLGTLPPTSAGLPAEALNVTPPAERVARTQAGSFMYLPTEEAQQASKGRAERQTLQDRLQMEAENRAPHVDTEHFSQPVMIDSQGNATPIKLPEGVTHQTKPPKTTYHYQTDENGVLTRFPSEEEGTPQQWMGPDKGWVTAPKVVGREYTQARADAEQRQQDAQERRDQARRDRIQKTIDTLQDKEQKQHSLALTYGTILNQGDVDENKKPVFVEDPESRRRVPLKSMRQLYESKVKRAQDMAGIFAAQQRQILASAQGQPQTAAPQTPTQGPPQRAEQTQGPPTRQAPTTGSPSSQAPVTRIPQYRPGPRTRAAERQNPTVQQQKSATLGDVRTYAQRKGISEAQALREFQGSGYAIGQ